MAESKIKNGTVETLASGTDAYATAWTLYRLNRQYILTLHRTNQSVARPAGAITCPLSLNSAWLPPFNTYVMGITQDGKTFNIGATPTALSGWMNSQTTGQMFAQLTWFK